MIGVAGAATGEIVLVAEEPTSISDTIFLIPNGTFFYELILFAVVFFVFAKFIVPPIRQAMADRDERVRQTQRDNEEADQRYAEAKGRHDEVLAEARSSATAIRDEARTAVRTEAEETRGEAEREAASVREQGERQLTEQRSRVRDDVYTQLPDLAGTLAQRILGRPLSGSARQRSTTDEYLQSIDRSRTDGSSGSSASTVASVSGAPAASGAAGGAEES